jgi:teichuronic acid biosynthesis glycosyltransferase TuaG
LVGLCGSSEAALALNEVQAARCVGEVTMSNPVVSVCLPTYNGGAFLALTLKSIAAQTFEDYEVIIVDDQSTDDSVALVEQYAASDPRVKLLQPSGRAGSSARNANRCVQHARGEWIKFIFSRRRNGA